MNAVCDARKYLRSKPAKYVTPPQLGTVSIKKSKMTIKYKFDLKNQSNADESIEVDYSGTFNINPIARKLVGPDTFHRMRPEIVKNFEKQFSDEFVTLIDDLTKKLHLVESRVKPKLLKILEDEEPDDDNASTTGVYSPPDEVLAIDLSPINDERASAFTKLEKTFHRELSALFRQAAQAAILACIKKHAKKNKKATVDNLDRMKLAEKVGNIVLIVAILTVTIIAAVATGGVGAGVAAVVAVAFMALFSLDGANKIIETSKILWKKHIRIVDAFQIEIGNAVASIEKAEAMIAALHKHGETLREDTQRLRDALEKSEKKLDEASTDAKMAKAKKTVDQLREQVKQLEDLSYEGAPANYLEELKKMKQLLNRQAKVVPKESSAFGSVLGLVFNGFALLGRLGDMKKAI